MKRKSPFGFIAFSLVAITTCVLALRFVAVNAPKSVLGENLFRWEYARATDKSAVFDDYRARIWEHGGGYVSDNTASFLAQRSNDGDDREVAAIARFYSRQSGMREGNFGQLLSERARQRVVDSVLRDWRTYPEKNAWRAFVLIETLRQNQYLGKASISGLVWPYSYDKTAPIAAKFEAWNRRYRATPIPQRLDPLAGTSYQIQAP